KECVTLYGEIVAISTQLRPAVELVSSGDTHQGYQCRVNGRLVTQSDFYGQLMMQIDLAYEKAANKLLAISTNPIILDASTIAKDPAMTEIVRKAKALTDPIANHPIATIGAEQLPREPTAAGESALGDLLHASQPIDTKDSAKASAVSAVMNPG